MTRKQRINKENPFELSGFASREKIINDIYDDFESRKCGTCDWYSQAKCQKFDIRLGKDFGCVDYEKDNTP